MVVILEIGTHKTISSLKYFKFLSKKIYSNKAIYWLEVAYDLNEEQENSKTKIELTKLLTEELLIQYKKAGNKRKLNKLQSHYKKNISND